MSSPELLASAIPRTFSTLRSIRNEQVSHPLNQRCQPQQNLINRLLGGYCSRSQHLMSFGWWASLGQIHPKSETQSNNTLDLTNKQT
jgi:hypothetical protein